MNWLELIAKTIKVHVSQTKYKKEEDKRWRVLSVTHRVEKNVTNTLGVIDDPPL